MPRPPRVDFAGAWHHVMNRSVDRIAVFQRDSGCRTFLASLELAADRFHLEVHAYCLMSNHFHLLVRSGGQLASSMQFLLGRFTRLTNLHLERDGPLFRGRYSSVPVTADHQLLNACRYIHLNPVAAELVDHAEAWLWSSAAAYAGAAASPRWLRRDVILDFFGPTDQVARYKDFMADGEKLLCDR